MEQAHLAQSLHLDYSRVDHLNDSQISLNDSIYNETVAREKATVPDDEDISAMYVKNLNST